MEKEVHDDFEGVSQGPFHQEFRIGAVYECLDRNSPGDEVDSELSRSSMQLREQQNPTAMHPKRGGVGICDVPTLHALSVSWVVNKGDSQRSRGLIV